MEYSFDKIINRKNTGSLKYDTARQHGLPEDVLPFWVADMDFQVPKEVIEALVARSQHGIFGYTEPGESYYQVVRNWFYEHFGWETQPQWMVQTPGVVFAIAAAVRAFTREGEGVLIQQPVYYPFGRIIRDNHRRLINNPLVYRNGGYTIDFQDFEAKIVENQVKLFILCSPHNPVGRVWTKEELRRMADICLTHGVIVVSDEIHADFVWPGHRHTVFATLGEEHAQNAVICTAPTKTFNLAGLQVSNIFIPNPELRKKFQQEISKTGYGRLNTMGIVACEAAYAYGREWLEQLKTYLEGNIQLVRTFLQERLPMIHLVEPQGTYLLWLDFSRLGLSESQREELIVHKAKLWFDTGTMFGPEGAGFERINIACPRPLLQVALERLERAIRSGKNEKYK